MSIYNTGIPTMPFYDVTKREFGEMMTPQDQIMWLYYHMAQEASVDYVDSENARQDSAFTTYQGQVLVMLNRLKAEIMADVDIVTKYGNLWACQVGQELPSKQAVRLAHKDVCALLGASVEELASGMPHLATVQALAESGLNCFGMAAYAKTYSANGTIGAPGAATYPF